MKIYSNRDNPCKDFSWIQDDFALYFIIRRLPTSYWYTIMELLERASQLQALNLALERVKTRDGQGCIVLVYGEAGIGKTSLVEHFINEHKTKWRILQGACDSLFTPRQLGPLHDIASQTQGDLLNLLESEANRTAIFSACLNELQQPATILAIEDVHWAD